MDERLEQIILQAAAELEASLEGAPATSGSAPQHVGDKRLAAIIRQANRGIARNEDHVAKKHLMPFYRNVRNNDPARWESWGISARTEEALLALLQVKPRRTASGVATISVITKPWPCASNCLYCPNDLRMPKSYIADEPACQRAERNWFDPYLQVSARLHALTQMGHVTDKVELIILGGSWTDYPAAYQRWFVRELFRALNEAQDDDVAQRSRAERSALYEQAGIPRFEQDCRAFVRDAQNDVNAGRATYNQAFSRLYETGAWAQASQWQQAGLSDVKAQHERNESGAHRVVGLVMETRPDAVDASSFLHLRQLGCTKVQMGIQSLDERVLQLNRRRVDVPTIRRAFELARLFGFKTHAHFMVNLLGATPAKDARDYLRLMDDAAIAPDEVKLYPCALVEGTDLVKRFEEGAWRPYSEDELTDVLAADLMATKQHVRVSRMIRDIPAQNILVGNKKINLRQTVETEAERRAAAAGKPIEEIRHREISVGGADVGELSLKEEAYRTTVTDERFLQWVAPDGRIAGFLRLSLPHADALARLDGELEAQAGKGAHPGCLPPIRPGEAMIREVHVYGRVAGLHRSGAGAQHHGLGRALVERACAIAHEQGYRAVNVISAVGTRGYYRNLGFRNNGLYQQRSLE